MRVRQAIPVQNLRDDADGPAALSYLLAHDKRVKFIDTLPLRELRKIWEQGLEMAGMTSLMGGPDDHDQLVNYIADQEFPDMTRARAVHYDWVMAAQPALGQE